MIGDGPYFNWAGEVVDVLPSGRVSVHMMYDQNCEVTSACMQFFDACQRAFR